MITVLELAKLASQIYTSTKSHNIIAKSSQNTSPLPHTTVPSTHSTQWHEVVVDPNIQSIRARQHGFYASLFVKVQNNQPICAVIAIRGTNNLDNIKQDIKSWWHSVFDNRARVILPEHYMIQAKTFYFKVRQYCKKELQLHNSQIVTTGHSLGGAIAALLPAYYGFPIRAVTFNAPGIKDIRGIKDYWHRIINFRATYDFISAIDYPVGASWNIPVADHQAEAAQAFAIGQEHERNGWSRLNLIGDLIESVDFADSVLHQHSMSNLLKSLTILAATKGGLASSDVFGTGLYSVENLSSVRDNQPYNRFSPFSQKSTTHA